MSEECTHDCKTCSQNCAERDPASFLKPLNPYSRVGKVIGVVSGKGGVGKSMVTSLLAVNMARRGHKVGILDADITGPSIPQAFGIHGNCLGSEMGIEPAESERGLKVMSINLLLENETDPVVWRGSVISGAVTQFWTDVHWGEVDYLFVDMPPGTGDVPLTVFQSLPVDGVVVVSTPQELVGMIVEKCVNMAGLMDKQVVGLVENMSYFKRAHRGGGGRLARRALRRHRRPARTGIKPENQRSSVWPRPYGGSLRCAAVAETSFPPEEAPARRRGAFAPPSSERDGGLLFTVPPVPSSRRCRRRRGSAPPRRRTAPARSRFRWRSLPDAQDTPPTPPP